MAQLVKNPPAMQETRFNPWIKKTPGKGKSYPLQYSGLENSMACIAHGVAKSWTRPSDFHSFYFIDVNKQEEEAVNKDKNLKRKRSYTSQVPLRIWE